MGILATKKSLVQLEQLSTSSFCRRRLAVVAVRLKMAQTVKEAATYVEQGHIRVGPGAQRPLRCTGCHRCPALMATGRVAHGMPVLLVSSSPVRRGLPYAGQACGSAS